MFIIRKVDSNGTKSIKQTMNAQLPHTSQSHTSQSSQGEEESPPGYYEISHFQPVNVRKVSEKKKVDIILSTRQQKKVF
jgi:hypothetical protein